MSQSGDSPVPLSAELSMRNPAIDSLELADRQDLSKPRCLQRWELAYVIYALASGYDCSMMNVIDHKLDH